MSSIPLTGVSDVTAPAASSRAASTSVASPRVSPESVFSLDMNGAHYATRTMAVTEDLVVGTRDSNVLVVSRHSKRVLQHCTQHNVWIWSVCLTQDGSVLYSGSEDRSVIMWNLKTGLPVHVFRGHEQSGTVISVIEAGDGDSVWSIDESGVAFQLRAHDLQPVRRIEQERRPVDQRVNRPIRTACAGRFVLIVSRSGVLVYDTHGSARHSQSEPQFLGVLGEGSEGVDVAVDAAGNLLVTTTEKVICARLAMDADSPQPSVLWNVTPGPCMTAAFLSADASRLFVAARRSVLAIDVLPSSATCSSTVERFEAPPHVPRLRHLVATRDTVVAGEQQGHLVTWQRPDPSQDVEVVSECSVVLPADPPEDEDDGMLAMALDTLTDEDMVFVHTGSFDVHSIPVHKLHDAHRSSFRTYVIQRGEFYSAGLYKDRFLFFLSARGRLFGWDTREHVKVVEFQTHVHVSEMTMHMLAVGPQGIFVSGSWPGLPGYAVLRFPFVNLDGTEWLASTQHDDAEAEFKRDVGDFPSPHTVLPTQGYRVPDALGSAQGSEMLLTDKYLFVKLMCESGHMSLVRYNVVSGEAKAIDSCAGVHLFCVTPWADNLVVFRNAGGHFDLSVVDFAGERMHDDDLATAPAGMPTAICAYSPSNAPDKRYVVTAHDEMRGVNDCGDMFVWDAQQGVRLYGLRSHTHMVLDIHYTPHVGGASGGKLLTSSMDEKICVWLADSHELDLVIRDHNDNVYSSVVSTAGMAYSTGFVVTGFDLALEERTGIRLSTQASSQSPYFLNGKDLVEDGGDDVEDLVDDEFDSKSDWESKRRAALFDFLVLGIVLLVVEFLQLASFAFTLGTGGVSSGVDWQLGGEMQDVLEFAQEVDVLDAAFDSKFVLSILVVVVLWAMLLVQEAIEWRRFLNPDSKLLNGVWSVLSLSTQLMATAFFLPIFTVLVAPFACTKVDGEWRWDQDIDVVCWEGSHAVRVAVGAVACVGFLVPVVRLLRVGAVLENIELKPNVFDWGYDSGSVVHEHPLSSASTTQEMIVALAKAALVVVQLTLSTRDDVQAVAQLAVPLAIVGHSLLYPPCFSASANGVRMALDVAVLLLYGGAALELVTGEQVAVWCAVALLVQLPVVWWLTKRAQSTGARGSGCCVIGLATVEDNAEVGMKVGKMAVEEMAVGRRSAGGGGGGGGGSSSSSSSSSSSGSDSDGE